MWLLRQNHIYDCCELVSSFKNATDIIKGSKLLKKMKEDFFVKPPKLKEHLTVIAYHDASYANLNNRGSQAGHVVSVTQNQEKYFSLIVLQSKTINCVVKTILAAETLSLSEIFF